ncbi:MAG TPA: DUF5723 family protein [Cyclobacteriaceae bacterium]|nr:DUF5723 family protein [Cyclobacteriaceae bacterium]
MKKAAFILLMGAILLAETTFGQNESTLYFMNSLPQVVDMNPAVQPRYKMTIGLPVISSIGATYSNNGFTYNDMISRVDGVVKADLSKLTQNLAAQNYITLSQQTDLLRFGLRLNPKMYLMFSSTARGYNRAMVEKGLASVLVDGTAPLVGSYSNTAPKEEGIGYLETAAGLSYKMNDKLTIGGRLKYYKGMLNVTTESSSLVVQVDNAYQLTVTGDALVKTSGVQNLNSPGYQPSDHVTDYLKNSGLGIDLGVTYKFMEKLTVSASLLDLGYINWTNNTYQYTLNPATAKYTFGGIDVSKLLDGNATSFSAQVDSIQKKFEMKEAPIGSYKTMLPLKMYLGAQYEIIPNLNVGALFFNESYRGRSAAGMTASVNKNFGKWVSTSLSYTVSNRSYNNIGLGVSFNVAPVQLYIVGDNLLRAPASLVADQTLNSYLNSSQLLSVRAGLNIVIGWDKGLTPKVKVSDDDANPVQKTNDAKVKNTYGRNPAKKDHPKAAKRQKTLKNHKPSKKPAKSKVGR